MSGIDYKTAHIEQISSETQQLRLIGFRVIFVLCAHVVMVRQIRDVRGCVAIGLDCQIQAIGALGCSGMVTQFSSLVFKMKGRYSLQIGD